MQLLTVGKRPVTALAFAPDSQALVAACSYEAARLWELPAVGKPIPLVDTRTYLSHITFSADSKVVGWLLRQKRMEHDRRTGITRELILTQDGEGINSQVICGPDHRLIVRTIQRGVGFHIRAFTPDDRGDWTHAWTVNMKNPGWQLAAGVRGDRFFTWEDLRKDTENPRNVMVVRSSLTGEIITNATVPVHYTLGFTTKPDGSALVVYKDSSLYYWQPEQTVQKVRTGTLKHYRSVAFHPTGRYLLAGNNDATARLIDTQTWQVVRQFTWKVGELSAVAISPDGMLAAAGGRKGSVVVWDLDV